MERTTHTLSTPDVDLVYDVTGPLPPAGGLPVLLMAGHPMTADGLGSLASYLGDRTVVTYDPRGLGRSQRKDGREDRGPELHAADLHALVEHLGTDAEHPFAAEQGFQRGFISFTSWRGEFSPHAVARPAPDPAQLGLPADGDGARGDPLPSGASGGITGYTVDVDALLTTPTRVVVGVGRRVQRARHRADVGRSGRGPWPAGYRVPQPPRGGSMVATGPSRRRARRGPHGARGRRRAAASRRRRQHHGARGGGGAHAGVSPTCPRRIAG